MRQFAVMLAPTIASVLLGLHAASGKALLSTRSAKCKVVTKIVHGKKRRTRICTKVPKPPLPQAGTVAATIPIGAHVNSVTATANGVWVVTDDRRLLRIDPATNAIMATITLPGSEWPEFYVAYGNGSVWVTVPSPDTIDQPELDSILRIDPATDKIVARIHVGHSPSGIAITPDAVWTANHRADWPSDGNQTGQYYVSRVDVGANIETERVLVETRATPGSPHDHWCCGPSGLTVAAGALWVTDPGSYGNGMVIRLDPVTNAVTARISFENSVAVACGNVVGTDTAIWVSSGCDNTYVARIDPQTNRIVKTIDTGALTEDIALGFDSVWGTTGGFVNGGLYRIDPATNELVGRTRLADAGGLAIGGGSVWVGTEKNLVRITPREETP